ncbi:MAG: hypothetical protein IJT56_05780, partial [Clostridia bacterium]|nr:hypothetical protein [Clostridia bacterium]
SVVMSGTVIKAGASVDYSIVDSDDVIGCGCVIGEPKTDGAKITLVGSELTLPDGLRIEPGSMINAEALAGLVKSK